MNEITIKSDEYTALLEDRAKLKTVEDKTVKLKEAHKKELLTMNDNISSMKKKSKVKLDLANEKVAFVNNLLKEGLWLDIDKKPSEIKDDVLSLKSNLDWYKESVEKKNNEIQAHIDSYEEKLWDEIIESKQPIISKLDLEEKKLYLEDLLTINGINFKEEIKPVFKDSKWTDEKKSKWEFDFRELRDSDLDTDAVFQKIWQLI